MLSVGYRRRDGSPFIAAVGKSKLVISIISIKKNEGTVIYICLINHFNFINFQKISSKGNILQTPWLLPICTHSSMLTVFNALPHSFLSPLSLLFPNTFGFNICTYVLSTYNTPICPNHIIIPSTLLTTPSK